jgi:hypothetical protein
MQFPPVYSNHLKSVLRIGDHAYAGLNRLKSRIKVKPRLRATEAGWINDTTNTHRPERFAYLCLLLGSGRGRVLFVMTIEHSSVGEPSGT